MKVGVGFFTGLLWGSLVSALSFRLPRFLAIGTQRSFCPACQTKLGPAQLIPLVSFLLQGGQCHACRTPIHARYPLIECLCGLLSLIIWQHAHSFSAVALHSAMMVACMTICVIDLENQRQSRGMWLFLWALVALIIVLQPAPTKNPLYVVAGLSVAGAAIAYGHHQRPASQSLWYGQAPIGLALAAFDVTHLLHFFMLSGTLMIITEYGYQQETLERRHAVATLAFTLLTVTILA